MKISKSKRQLAQLLIEAGVTKFPEGANWAAQDRDDKTVYMHSLKPNRPVDWSRFSHKKVISGSGVPLPTITPNWHQTVLSRDEFGQIVAETVSPSAPDADGWIKWNGGECPVGDNVMVEIKTRDGETQIDESYYWNWSHTEDSPVQDRQIIFYRLHKPELAKSTAVGDDETNLAAKEELEAMNTAESPEECAKLARIYAPTIDRLLQDWRNADDFAKRKQAEADEAAAMCDERWQAVQDRAGEFGLMISPCVTKQQDDAELVITNWRDLREGDVIVLTTDSRYNNTECVMTMIDGYGLRAKSSTDTISQWYRLRDESEWRFIRRP